MASESKAELFKRLAERARNRLELGKDLLGNEGGSVAGSRFIGRLKVEKAEADLSDLHTLAGMLPHDKLCFVVNPDSITMKRPECRCERARCIKAVEGEK